MENPFEDWPDICATCGELLQPTLDLGSLSPAPQQWLHADVGVDHAPVPVLLPPER
jgi:hypothetical protein